MKELEDTDCEVRKIVELQSIDWNYQNGSIDDDARPVLGSPGADEYTNFMGGFLDDVNYAWLSCGPKLVVFNAKTGVSISTWTFRERISCLSPFPAQPGQIPLLLVGLDNDANKVKDSVGIVCIFDCTISQVLRAVRMPAGVEQLCIIHGGAEWEEMNDKRVDNILVDNHGVAYIALRNLDHYIMDLRRNTWENLINFPFIDESNPAEISLPNSGNSSTRHKPNKERHTVYNLMNERLERYIGYNRAEFESLALYREKITTSIVFSRKIGCLISGCLGRIIIWQNDGVVRWVSSPMDNNMAVSHLALLEPTDDPRPFCYLWIAYQEEMPSNTRPILRMYAMLFEGKYSDKGTNLYLNLEVEPSLKFELEMEENDRITSLCPIMRDNYQEQTESGNKRGEDNLLLINLKGKNILFDLNQWYKEQMPRFIGECHNAGAILSCYQSEYDLSLKNTIVSCAYVSSTLKEFSCTTSTTPEELFFPNSLSFEWVELGTKRLTLWMTRGVQAQLLRKMAIAGPIIMVQPLETFQRCITAGLIPYNPDHTSCNNTADGQRDALLTLCLEQRWTAFLLKCAKEWSDGSAAYMYPAFLRWAIQRASTIQLTAHQLCIPLFDLSGNSIGEAEVKTLRFYSQQMECLSNVIDNLSIDTGDLDKQRRTLRRISIYLQILLWFYDVGLLPETQDINEGELPISFIQNIAYPAEKLASIYAEKRKEYRQNFANKGNNEAVMFIDELITRECPALKAQWEQESNEISHDGHYPPPSLQSLLRSCLIDCYNDNVNEMENKHQIIIYLLMDLVMLLQGSCPGVDQLIKYPSAFKLSPSLIKLTQALWFLDHEDFQGFLDIMTGQLVSESDIKDWHHKLVMRTLLRSNQSKLALIYIKVRKPPLSSIDDQGTVIHLSVEHGLVQSAFHHRPPTHYKQLLTKFFHACKAYGKLNDILHLALDTDEEEAFLQFLDEQKCEETRLIYFLQHSRYNEANRLFPPDLNFVNSKKSKISTSLSMFHAYNATLPDITRRFTTNFIRRNIDIDSESQYPQPMSHYKSPGCTRDIYEMVIEKAKETFNKNDRYQIPFISAPCSSLKSTLLHNESNRVLFPERAPRPCAKRTLQEMRNNDTIQDETPDAKRRRKVTETSDRIDDTNTKNIDINMEFGTPLIKRKNQIINASTVPSETPPHSILKIRQLIRDSSSPTAKGSLSENEKTHDTLKKPRQIRFSINQPNLDHVKNEESLIDNKEGIEQLDTTESIQSGNFTPSDNSGDEEDEYFSPNTNTKSLNESTVLTDSSSYHSKSLSGPRPRPGLRRNNIDSPFGEIRKSSKRYSIMTIESASNSPKTSADISITSDIVSSTFIDSCTPRVSHSRTALPFTSVYASTVLSSNTSVEFSPHESFHETKNNVSDISNSFKRTLTKLSLQRDIVLGNEPNEEGNLSNNPRCMTYSETSFKKIRNIAENDEDEDNFSNREIDNADNLSTDVQDEMFKRCSSSEANDHNEVINSVLPHKISSDHQIEFHDEHREDAQEDNNATHISNKIFEGNEDTECVIDDYTLKRKLSDDFDDELLALRYDEEDDDNEDVFKSLSNSVERDHHQLGRVSDKLSTQNDSSKRTAPKRLYDEFNITDDESSHSIDQNDVTDILKKQNTKTNVATAESSAVMHSVYDDADITDDKSDDSLDSAKFSTDSNTDRNMNERSNSTTRRSIYYDEKNEVMSQNEQQETNELEIVETNDQTSAIVREPSCDIISDNETDNLTSVQSLRGSRASSVVPIIQDPHSEKSEIENINRIRRATSLDNEMQSTPTTFCTESPASNDSVENSMVKKRRGRRPTSLMKEVLTAAIPIEPNLDSIIESPVRRSTRRAASIQKDIPESVKTPTKNSTLGSNPPIIETNSADKQQPVRKTRLKRTMSINKYVDSEPRKIETLSEENHDLAVKSSGARGSETPSMSLNTDEQIVNANTTSGRKRRATSISKESLDKSSTKQTKSKRTRAASVIKDVIEEISTADITRPRRTRAASVSNENTEESIPRRKRATSVTNEESIKLSPRRTRATSLTKDIEINSSASKRLTRASSLTKEISIDGEITTNKRVTRRTASLSKDVTLETTRPRRGSTIKNIIPEENDTELILNSRRLRTPSQVVEDTSEYPSDSTLSHNFAIVPILEEDSEEEILNDVPKKKEKKGVKASIRDRRATSVDLPQIEVKRRTRGLLKSMSNDDCNGSEESLVVDGTNKRTRKITQRLTRAVSETKEVGDMPLARSRRGTKLSQINESNDTNCLEVPENIRDETDNILGANVQEYIISPPMTKSASTFSNQPRRLLANFVSPFTDEEEKMITKMATGNSSKSKNGRQSRRTSSVLGVRTKFVIRSRNSAK